MDNTSTLRAIATGLSSVCSARFGDCIGMVVAGAVFMSVSPSDDAGTVFRTAGACLAAAGAVFTAMGLKRRTRQ